MAVPGLNVDPEAIRQSARQLGTAGTRVADLSFDVADQWEGLRACYDAVEAPALVGAVRALIVPPGQDTRVVADKVSQALTTFADDVEPVVAELRALAADDSSDPETAAQIARVAYRFAELERACADAIRAAVGLGPRDVGLLQQFAPEPEQPGLLDWLLFGAQAGEFGYWVGRSVQRPRGRRPGEGPDVPELPEIPQAQGPLPPLPVPVGGLSVRGGVAAADLADPTIAGSPTPMVTGEYVPDADPDLTPPPSHVVIVERDDNGRADLLNRPLQPDTRYVVDDVVDVYDGNNPKPRSVSTPGAFIYETDSQGRVVHAEGTLTSHHPQDDQVRDAGAQKGINHKFPGDHAGHLFGAQFGGPGESANLVAQDPAVNNGGIWKSSEASWRDAVKNHQEVRVKIDLSYDAAGRPTEFHVSDVESERAPDATGQRFPGKEFSDRDVIPNNR